MSDSWCARTELDCGTGRGGGAASAQAAPSQVQLQAAQWPRVRALAHDPNFVVDDQILKRYAGTLPPNKGK